MNLHRLRRVAIILALLMIVVATPIVHSRFQRSKLRHELLNAVSKGDHAAVAKLLRTGADPNSEVDTGQPFSGQVWDTLQQMKPKRDWESHTEPPGTTVLMAAVSQRDTVSAKLLIGAGAHINDANLTGETTLMVAASDCPRPLLELLLSRGASVNARDARGTTALMIAARSGQRYAIERFIQHGADINARDSEGRTALMSATVNSWVSEIRILLDKGADRTLRDNNGNTAITIASDLGDTVVLKALDALK